MSQNNKWCEWCYAPIDMTETECKYCESGSFLHSNPFKEPIDPRVAKERRKNGDYVKVSPVIHDLSEQSRHQEVSAQNTNPKVQKTISPEEQKLNEEIADLVIKIELAQHQLKQLLAQKSPELQELEKANQSGNQTQTITTTVSSFAVSSSVFDAIGDFFS